MSRSAFAGLGVAFVRRKRRLVEATDAVARTVVSESSFVYLALRHRLYTLTARIGFNCLGIEKESEGARAGSVVDSTLEIEMSTLQSHVVITDIVVPAESFALGRLLSEHPNVEIELERMVPARDTVIPLFWVDGAEPDAVEGTLSSDAVVDDARILTETAGRALFEVHWSDEVNHLVQPIIETDARLLSGTGGAAEWTFRIQFGSKGELAEFRERCLDNGVHIRVRRLFDRTWPADQDPLTAAQKDAIVTAWENGYFEVPRGVTLEELASLIGISDNSASQRLRRGLSTLVGSTLASEY